jgi:hypothetical protein
MITGIKSISAHKIMTDIIVIKQIIDVSMIL